MPAFKIHSKFKPSDAQEQAITGLVNGINTGVEFQTLLGVTGSGKTFTMANVVERLQRPTLVMAHNKTLAAQLYSEFREFFPDNAVEYFVSYYDYYQPEAYVPSRDLYIEKESDINETIERYRNAATQSLLTRPDTLIVASVSCIYGLGNPTDYMSLSRKLSVGENYKREKLLIHLSDMQYERSEFDFYPGMYRVRGDIVDVYLASDTSALRVEYFGDEIEQLKMINPLTGEVTQTLKAYQIFPAKHFVTPFESLKKVIPTIRIDLEKEVQALEASGKMLEAQRLKQRVSYDIEMLQEVGYCSGIENYSRYIDRRPPGTPPSTLLDYFPDDWLLFADESHMTLPQIRGMFNGDLARKQTLVDYGFRLQSAKDNRPLKYEEFMNKLSKTVFVSATPNDYELALSRKAAAQANPTSKYDGHVEQLIRPTGLLDPVIDIRPISKESSDKLLAQMHMHGYDDMEFVRTKVVAANQIDDLLKEIQLTTAQGLRTLVTTLTKRMAEDLKSYLEDIHIKVQYVHSDVDTVERVKILRDLRQGKYDVLVGVNLLREGLDLPEVALIGILDADKEGFLRTKSALVQIAGRAARHAQGRVIMYANQITGSMKAAIDETRRRRAVQEQYNLDHGITPTTIVKAISELMIEQEKDENKADKQELSLLKRREFYPAMPPKEQREFKREIELQMNIYADMLDFEKAAEMRDLLAELK